MQLGRMRLERLGAVDDDRQLVVVDLDRFHGVEGCRRRRGDDQRDFLADVTHALARERGTFRHLEMHAATAGKLHLRWRRLVVL